MNQKMIIKPSQQADIMSSFWTMLKELEGRANDDKDPILMHWVECWYRQWNLIAHVDLKPVWKK